MGIYQVIDATGAILRQYDTWEGAEMFRCVTGRHDWVIRDGSLPVDGRLVIR